MKHNCLTWAIAQVIRNGVSGSVVRHKKCLHYGYEINGVVSHFKAADDKFLFWGAPYNGVAQVESVTINTICSPGDKSFPW